MRYKCNTQQDIKTLDTFLNQRLDRHAPIDQAKQIIIDIIKANHYYKALTLSYTNAPFEKLYHCCFFNSGPNETSHQLLKEILELINYIEDFTDYAICQNVSDQIPLMMTYIQTKTLPALQKIRGSTNVPLACGAGGNTTIYYRGLYPNKTESQLMQLISLLKKHNENTGEIYDNAPRSHEIN